MLSENIKALRKAKGLSQEELASKLNVVRQTVSKWEKGLSVPDADLLMRLAELFEVSVSELLGSQIDENKNVNEIANQLVILLNEQFAERHRAFRKKALKAVVIAALVLLVVLPIVYVGGMITYKSHRVESETISKTKLICTLDEKEYYYEVGYNEQYKIVEAGGDAWIANHVMTEKYDDANVLIAQIEDYFKDRGGSVEIIENAE